MAVQRGRAAKPVSAEVDILSLLDQEDCTGTEARTSGGGSRGFWPGDKPDLAPGEKVNYKVECSIVGFTFDENAVSVWSEDGKGKRVKTDKFNPAYFFTYKVSPGAGAALGYPEWDGKTVVGERWVEYVHDRDKLEDWQVEAQKRANGRWAGFVEGILQHPLGNKGASIREMQDLFKDITEENGIPAVIEFTLYGSEGKKDRTGESSKTVVKPKYAEYCSEVLE